VSKGNDKPRKWLKVYRVDTMGVKRLIKVVCCGVGRIDEVA